MTEIMNSCTGHMQQEQDSLGTAQPADLPGNGHNKTAGVTSDPHAEHVVQTKRSNGDNSAPNLDIYINNVVCTFSVRCHLNLHRIGLEGINVEHRKEYGVSIKVVLRDRVGVLRKTLRSRFSVHKCNPCHHTN